MPSVAHVDCPRMPAEGQGGRAKARKVVLRAGRGGSAWRLTSARGRAPSHRVPTLGL